MLGASGNVGTAVLEAFAGDGHDLVGVCRRVPPEGAPYDGARWQSVDLARTTADELEPVFRGADAVVNLVWAFQPARDTGYLERVGVGGLRTVLEAARRAEIPHLVHMSSVGAYAAGPAEGGRVDESWPTTGIPTLAYSRHKAAAERLLDAHEAAGDPPVITRLRPGLVLQRRAGSALLRYGLPAFLPRATLDLVPVLPLDERFAIPVVHTSDVAAAVRNAVQRGVAGAFNLSADDPITRRELAEVLHAVPVAVPRPVVRAAVAAGWTLRLHRLDPGWIDLAFATPLIDTTRAREHLGWSPTWSARDALRDLMIGMRSAEATASPVLRRRTVLGEALDGTRLGPITRRALP
ncbi:nucleoside-diphosphate sugar epimerase [Nakamurella endophytica]|uniref:Nucleoside-diphosphate sugar epimerase n=1 Tax=Nakamurella endophytica TaxID=1748367 RepID=A0A917WJU6_9ACTN|nr:nucleoside-diphosphate sugar epimerase [Nakamurella endophytica]